MIAALAVLATGVLVVACNAPKGGDQRARSSSTTPVASATRSLLGPGGDGTFAPPEHVNFTLEGCRFRAGLVLPIGGKFICPDADYVTGNLGKGWNELDLVPHRLTTSLGTQTAATTDYDVYLAADYQNGGKQGYDVLSVPVVNAAKSDASCAATWVGDQATAGSAGSPFGGGTDVVAYRILEVHQAKGTTCVFDWYQRLALGSHEYSGSSLQSYMFPGANFSGSKKTISIPVTELLPQELSKTETAAEGADYQWSLTKTPSPANVTFDDTCDASKPLDAGPVTIRIEWTKLPAVYGAINVIAKVYATNPAARAVTISVTDAIYGGTAPAGPVLDTAQTAAPVTLPANTAGVLVLEHAATLDPGDPRLTALNDVATATYIDTVTGVSIPGTTTASATTPVQVTFENASATIEDSETIIGSGLTFSVAAPAVGAFSGYTAGEQTGGPVLWGSGSQAGTGSVDFVKRLYAAGPSTAPGTLYDEATLTGTGFPPFTAAASATVNIQRSAYIALTIGKTVDVAGGERLFKFYVCLEGRAECSWSSNDATAEVTIAAGQTTGSAAASPKLAPGKYVVHEIADGTGCGQAADLGVELALPTCATPVTVSNICNKDLTVTKTASASYTRTFKWAITKDVDKTQVNVAEGGSATFHYTVGVTHDAGTDGAWTVAGEITIVNPNAIDVGGVAVTDLAGATACTVSGGESVTVPASSSVVLPYSCTFASLPADGTNVATATWPASYGTPTTSATGSAAYAFGGPTTIVDGSVSVVDSVGGSLGTVSSTDASPVQFTYTRVVEHAPAGACTAYDNTATFTTDTTGSTGSASRTVKVCVGVDLQVTKTAAGTFDRTYLWKISKAADKTDVRIASGGTATFDYTVVAEQTGISDSGWAVSGKITVKNPNDWEDITADVTDVLDGGGTCTVSGGAGVAVPRSASVTLDYSCTFTSQPPYGLTNTATATWDKTLYTTPTGSASGSQSFALSQLGSTNKTVHVADTHGGDLGTVTGTDAAPFAKATFTYARTESGVGGTCTRYDNTATLTETGQSASASVNLCVGVDLQVTKTAAGTFDRTYLWKISKEVDQTLVKTASGNVATFHYTVVTEQTGISDSGWKASGKITVKNPNDWEDITADVTDVLDGGGTCTVSSGAGVTVPKSGSVELGYTCTFASQPASYSLTNTATATWSKTLYTTPNGSASGTSSFALAQLGSTNRTVHVTDSFGGSLGTVTATDAAPFAMGTFTYARTESGVGGTCTSYDNTATITETGESASRSVTLCVGVDLMVGKTVTATFDRTYLWTISKAVDQTLVKTSGGKTATFDYTVLAEQTGFSDSGWSASGVIAVTNPNDWEAIAASVTDALGGGSCVVAGGFEAVIPAGATQTFPYGCTFASQPAYTGLHNVATATWDPGVFSTPTGSASGSAAATFQQAGSTHRTVTVTDSYGGMLGIVTGTDAAPFARGTFTYARTESGVGGTCTRYDNTATITETGHSASQSVTLCVGLDLTVSKTATATFDRAYLWKISKAVDQTLVKTASGSWTFLYTVAAEQTGITDSGWAASGMITVTNPNDWEAIPVTVTDALSGGGTCTVEGGTGAVVPAGGSVTFSFTCSFSGQPAYHQINTGTAIWDPATSFTPSGSASGSAPVSFVQAGSTNRTVHVTDTVEGGLGTVTATDGAPFAKGTFTYARTVFGAGGKCTIYDNTAAITETGQSAGATATLCVGLDLVVTKTAAGTFDRAYLWKIAKAADKTLVTTTATTATFQYTVTAQQTGISDSGWQAGGEITVTNPNDWEAIAANVTDALAGGTCTVPDGAVVVVPASSSVTLAYTCWFESPPGGYDLTNTATAIWDAGGYATPSGSASGSASFALAQLGSTNRTVHVTDTIGGDLGSVTATDLAPFATGTFTYDRTVDVPAPPADPGCLGYDNTATITETDQSASQSVTACGPARVTIAKTVQGAAPASGQVFTFQIRQGASTTSDGTVLEQKDTDAGGSITFSLLLPGAYQICEWVFPGWNTNLAGDGPLFVPNSIIPPALPNPNVNNLTVCADFTVASGQARTFAVDNSPPPGGRALTIGFWKNWASCSASKGVGQKHMLDLALGIASATTANPPGGLVVSAQNAGSGWPSYASVWYLVLKGDPASTETDIKPAADCQKAVNLLNKTSVDGKKKMASDPLFSMTAQLVAAEANRFLGAGISGATITNINRAVLLDGKYKFNGSTYSPKLSAADTTLANCLATQLDNYNNNRPVGACP